MRRMLFVTALLCTATSCTAVTRTTVVITADEIVTAANPQVRVQVFRANDVNGTLDIEERNQPVPAELGYPIRIAIIPRGGDAGRRYDVRVTAMSGALTWSTRAISGFVPGQRRELRMRLEDVCRTRVCPTDQTCRADACVPIEVDPSMLVPPGTEVDASRAVDAAVPPGTDAAMDAFPTDTPRPDAPGGCATGIFGTSIFGSACFE